MTVESFTACLSGSFLRNRASRMLLMAGPAFAVSIGYIDPGNWATDLAAGRYGMSLLWVVLLASAMAIVLQMLTVRLAFATGESYATTLARRWPKSRAWFFGVAQFAAMATDVAEVTGVVVGLRLLFGFSPTLSAGIACAIVLSLLAFGNNGLRRLELTLMGFLGLIALAYLYEVGIFHPSAAAVVRGAILPQIPAPAAFAVLVGIIGATVMPHNLFLHPAFLVERFARPTWRDRRAGLRWFSNETIVALTIAMAVNAAILIVGASIGGAGGSIEQAYRTIVPFAGAAAAAVFGGALLCSGIAASATATIAGDVIARDLAPVSVSRNLRRALTLGPAVALIAAGADATTLLIWSQIALALVLPVVVIPLLVLCMRHDVMSTFSLPPLLRAAAILTASLCVVFDIALIVQL
ncbi:MAG: Nramp family divalent metal transporter [Vulcanimicrobiaceae bacterium]